MKVGLCFISSNEYDLNTYPPLGLLYLKAYAERECDFALDFVFPDNWRTIEPDCDIIGISCLSQDFAEASQASDELSKRGHLVIMGGVHISQVPESLPRSAVVGVMFEAEETFLQLLRLFNKVGRIACEDLRKLPSIIFRDGNRFVVNKRALPLNMDKIPFPDRRILMNPDQGLHLFTSRGCPFKCSFCSSSLYWKTVRCFTADYVVNEIALMAEEFSAFKKLTFADDLFILDRQRLRQIVAKLDERGLNGHFKTNCAIRVDIVDEELCQLLRLLNIEYVYFGLESASMKIQKALKGPMVTMDVTCRALEMLNSFGITTNVTFIVGTPGEKEEDLIATYDFLIDQTIKGRLEYAIANVLTPMPGTRVWQDAFKAGVISFPFDWGRLRYYAYLGKHHVSNLSVSEWARLRGLNGSIYLNSPIMDENRLYEIMDEKETLLNKLQPSRKNSDISHSTVKSFRRKIK